MFVGGLVNGASLQLTTGKKLVVTFYNIIWRLPTFMRHPGDSMASKAIEHIVSVPFDTKK
ncbi:MAG: hypothetical protein MI749_22345 [Desulfovibrionales bacterium]|nr:hypothetical protein [Desulfovibrionales bacterium]